MQTTTGIGTIILVSGLILLNGCAATQKNFYVLKNGERQHTAEQRQEFRMTLFECKKSAAQMYPPHNVKPHVQSTPSGNPYNFGGAVNYMSTDINKNNRLAAENECMRAHGYSKQFY